MTRVLSSMVALCVLLWGGPAAATTFVFATFKGDTDPGEKLSIYTSTDATHFTLVSDTAFEGSSGTLRDPSIMKHRDGKYYVAYTNPPTSSCCGREDHFSIASSTDLIRWTDLTTVPAGVPGAAHVWAPEWFVEGDTVRIIANIDTLDNDSDFKPYVFTAQVADLTSWSGPTALGIGPNYIDATVVKSGTTYHCFIKQETTRFLEHATAASLTGPWTFVGRGDWAGWGSGREGPNLVQLDNGTWQIFMDGQGAVGFLYATSPDLGTWSATTPLPGLSNLVRHGTVIRDAPVGGASGSGSTGAGGRPGTGGRAAGGAGPGSGGSPAASGGSDGGVTSIGGAGSAGSGDVTRASGGAGGGGTAGTGGSARTGGVTGRDAAMDGPTDSASPPGGPTAGASAGGRGCACATGPGATPPPPATAALSILALTLLGMRSSRAKGRRRRASRDSAVLGLVARVDLVFRECAAASRAARRAPCARWRRGGTTVATGNRRDPPRRGSSP